MNLIVLYLFVIMNIMIERAIPMIPRLLKMTGELGENIKLARLRRKLTTNQVCERAGIGRTTLWQIEKGGPSVTMGAYAQVLFVLGLETSLLKLGEDDELGRRLQDAEMEIKKKGPKRK
jgi:transcriptional regulator with XRE-family HTH domain